MTTSIFDITTENHLHQFFRKKGSRLPNGIAYKRYIFNYSWYLVIMTFCNYLYFRTDSQTPIAYIFRNNGIKYFYHVQNQVSVCWVVYYDNQNLFFIKFFCYIKIHLGPITNTDLLCPHGGRFKTNSKLLALFTLFLFFNHYKYLLTAAFCANPRFSVSDFAVKVPTLVWNELRNKYGR